MNVPQHLESAMWKQGKDWEPFKSKHYLNNEAEIYVSFIQNVKSQLENALMQTFILRLWHRKTDFSSLVCVFMISKTQCEQYMVVTQPLFLYQGLHIFGVVSIYPDILSSNCLQSNLCH